MPHALGQHRQRQLAPFRLDIPETKRCRWDGQWSMPVEARHERSYGLDPAPNLDLGVQRLLQRELGFVLSVWQQT